MRRHDLLLALLLSIGVLALAGCGDDDSSGAASSTPGTVASAAVQQVSPAEGAALIADLDGLTVIDVRTPAEFASGHLDGAVNLDLEAGQFTASIADLPHDAPYLVYCQSGRRSALAAQAMEDAGFTNVYDLGGISAWQDAGFPVVAG